MSRFLPSQVGPSKRMALCLKTNMLLPKIWKKMNQIDLGCLIIPVRELILQWDPWHHGVSGRLRRHYCSHCSASHGWETLWLYLPNHSSVRPNVIIQVCCFFTILLVSPSHRDNRIEGAGDRERERENHVNTWSSFVLLRNWCSTLLPPQALILGSAESGDGLRLNTRLNSHMLELSQKVGDVVIPKIFEGMWMMGQKDVAHLQVSIVSKQWTVERVFNHIFMCDIFYMMIYDRGLYVVFMFVTVFFFEPGHCAWCTCSFFNITALKNNMDTKDNACKIRHPLLKGSTNSGGSHHVLSVLRCRQHSKVQHVLEKLIWLPEKTA